MTTPEKVAKDNEQLVKSVCHLMLEISRHEARALEAEQAISRMRETIRDQQTDHRAQVAQISSLQARLRANG